MASYLYESVWFWQAYAGIVLVASILFLIIDRLEKRRDPPPPKMPDRVSRR